MMVSMADRLRPVPPALTREADVVAALDRLVDPSTGSQPDQASFLPGSGLLAMSIPASFGGADISNLIVAEAVSRLATWNMTAAERLLRHLVALEFVRTSGSTEQRKAIYARVVLGDVFDLAAKGQGSEPPRLIQSGLAFALERGVVSDLQFTSADWQIVRATAVGAKAAAAILDHTRAALNGEDDTSEVKVHPDFILSLGDHAESLARLMTAFLAAAATRGKVGAEASADTAGLPVAIELELLDAMIQRTASLLDGIQVDDPPLDLAQIDRFCRALDTARTRCSADR